MKEDLNNVIDFDGVNKGKIPADSFIIAMKRFIQRILQAESEKETHRLVDYMIDMSLNLWPSNNDIEEVLNQLFPQNLLVSNSLAAYEYVLQKKKSMGNKPIAINTFNSQTIASSSLDIKSSPSRSIHSSRKGKKVDRSKFDAM
ncbi:18027_t:CDS:2 [Funneliformis geosporum]|uniref:18027_t:CDS:1 n=1 Tax=Funneliformis geosporum TaxID=1117311 RepID=A0A9W4SPE0_9GLOM|nr:18027_t:CDS:2 [Funneliformis geosporum]